ncbi:hypothetical protein FPOAC1_000085 [Fusarium poae]|uniref:hypothetical protein n=1 Tax=Fusarium poae TaxID=36050 RepID=UPI001CEBECF6|nr:hypothetical protein FPOAC1_000085 [Fusarium poae]KAG8674122.1 hypothetical protein FPOAC1_000085 [Fusarium poae]
MISWSVILNFRVLIDNLAPFLHLSTSWIEWLEWFECITEYFHKWKRSLRLDFLDKLISDKGDEIWNAAIWHDDGEVARLLAEFEENIYLSNETRDPEMNRVEGFSPKFVIAKVVAELYQGYANNTIVASTMAKLRMKAIADRLAKTSRRITQKEWQQLQCVARGEVSILWIVITRNHLLDVKYLLKNNDIDLRSRNGVNQETVLLRAVSQNNEHIIRSILETNSSVPPLRYIDIGNQRSQTPLHISIEAYLQGPQQHDSEESHTILRICTLLLEHGANVNALDDRFQTPLHLLLGSRESDVPIGPLLQILLSDEAEINIKDIRGNSPLHLACKKQDRQAMKMLVEKGADLETFNRDGYTPREYLMTSEDDEEFWMDLKILTMTSTAKLEKDTKIPQRDGRISDRRMWICRKSPVYCRIQKSIQVTNRNIQIPVFWVGTGRYVSDVLYPSDQGQNVTFLEYCEREYEHVWQAVQKRLGMPSESTEDATREKGQVNDDRWRWVNFNANNMTWIKVSDLKSRKCGSGDFILDHTEELTDLHTKSEIWEFFRSNIRLRDGKERDYRIRAPHAQKIDIETSKSRDKDIPEAGSMVSIVMTDYLFEEKRVGEAYLPFTGMDGVQMPQTLDQTFNSAEGLSGLRSKENQVIYRWSGKGSSARHGQGLGKHKPLQPPRGSLGSRFKDWLGYHVKEEPDPDGAALDYIEEIMKHEGMGNATRMRSIKQEGSPKWLMVRQLWLWKLHDGTILTAIPSRENMGMADDLLETIRHSELDELCTADDLVKHIVQQTVTFPEKFRLAGLGEHILDIFENELASEMDREAGFFNSFTRKDWNSRFANKAISEAAGCTWRVKDIRGELRLIDKVFTQQLDVLKEFAAVVETDKGMSLEEQEATLIRESGLEVLRERIRRIDEDAATTIDGLSNITQAMLAQASLKEAESARLMNFIILPFTVVTVIFTPLSFMTSLFAVNSDGFPHNDEGELRIPSNWLRDKMIIGEIGTLIPLLIIIVSISYLRTGTRRTPK